MKHLTLRSSGILLFHLVTFCVMLLNIPLGSAENRVLTVDDDGPADFHVIQEAVDAANVGDTVYVYKGSYFENVVVNKSLRLVGETQYSTFIDGSGLGLVLLFEAGDCELRNFTIRGGEVGVNINFSDRCIVSDNILVDNVDALVVNHSSEIRIARNTIQNNTQRGVILSNSARFVVEGNAVYGNGMYGINANASSFGTVTRNVVYENFYDGIGLLNSSDCLISENTATNERFGVWVDSSSGNMIVHNNFKANFMDAVTVASTNTWDDGIEGNYWGSYSGADLDNDGVGDSWHQVDPNNFDRYPLMGAFNSVNTSLDKKLTIVSNSTVTAFQYFEPTQTAKLNVENSTTNQTGGFCRICIPHSLMDMSNLSIVIDGGLVETLIFNDTLYDNGTHRWIYFTYRHSPHEIQVLPEFSYLTAASLLLAFLAAITFKKKQVSNLR